MRISDRATTLFFFIVSESIGVACAEESMCHLPEAVSEDISEGQRLSFP